MIERKCLTASVHWRWGHLTETLSVWWWVLCYKGEDLSDWYQQKQWHSELYWHILKSHTVIYSDRNSRKVLALEWIETSMTRKLAEAVCVPWAGEYSKRCLRVSDFSFSQRILSKRCLISYFRKKVFIRGKKNIFRRSKPFKFNYLLDIILTFNAMYVIVYTTFIIITISV